MYITVNHAMYVHTNGNKMKIQELNLSKLKVYIFDRSIYYAR